MSKWFLRKVQKQSNRGRIPFSTNGAGVTGHPQQKSEPWSVSQIIEKLTKIDHRLKCKM